MRRRQHTARATEPVYVPVEVIVGDEVCRAELTRATLCSYERVARRRGVSVADLLRDAVSSMLADRGPLN